MFQVSLSSLNESEAGSEDTFYKEIEKDLARMEHTPTPTVASDTVSNFRTCVSCRNSASKDSFQKITDKTEIQCLIDILGESFDASNGVCKICKILAVSEAEKFRLQDEHNQSLNNSKSINSDLTAKLIELQKELAKTKKEKEQLTIQNIESEQAALAGAPAKETIETQTVEDNVFMPELTVKIGDLDPKLLNKKDLERFKVWTKTGKHGAMPTSRSRRAEVSKITHELDQSKREAEALVTEIAMLKSGQDENEKVLNEMLDKVQREKDDTVKEFEAEKAKLVRDHKTAVDALEQLKEKTTIDTKKLDQEKQERDSEIKRLNGILEEIKSRNTDAELARLRSEKASLKKSAMLMEAHKRTSKDLKDKLEKSEKERQKIEESMKQALSTSQKNMDEFKEDALANEHVLNKTIIELKDKLASMTASHQKDKENFESKMEAMEDKLYEKETISRHLKKSNEKLKKSENELEAELKAAGDDLDKAVKAIDPQDFAKSLREDLDKVRGELSSKEFEARNAQRNLQEIKAKMSSLENDKSDGDKKLQTLETENVGLKVRTYYYTISTIKINFVVFRLMYCRWSKG